MLRETFFMNLHPKAGPGLPKGYKFNSTLIKEKARKELLQIFMDHWQPVLWLLLQNYSQAQKSYRP